MPRLHGEPLLPSDASDSSDTVVTVDSSNDFSWTDPQSKPSFPSSAIPSRPASPTSPKPPHTAPFIEIADDTDSAPPTPLPWTPRRAQRAKRVLDDDDEDGGEVPFQAATATEMDDPADPILDWDDDVVYGSMDNVPKMESVVELPTSTLISPRSAAVNYEPSLPVTAESHACDELIALAEADAHTAPDYVYIELDEFEVYYTGTWYKSRLQSLHLLGSDRKDRDEMFFDGVLRVGNTRFYVERVPFRYAPVDHYGPAYDTVRGHISIRSLLNSERDVYYRLGRPSSVYARFYYPYLWVADLGKHFVDYVDAATNKTGGDVRISHFRASFCSWLNRAHARSVAVAAWKRRFWPKTTTTETVIDFRSAVVAYKDYLKKEAVDVLGADVFGTLGFFKEMAAAYYPVHAPRVPANHPPNTPLPTVVTPYIYHTFRGLAIQKYMVSTRGKYTPAALGNATLLPQGQTSFIPGTTGADETLAERIRRIQPGDVISTTPDGKGSGSKWSMDFDDDDDIDDDTPSQTDKRWYALVHRVRRDGAGQQTFEIAWLYAPQHTPCRQSRYPWPNELFLSDHCTCDEGADACIRADEIASVHAVEWFGGPDTTADFFIRQTFLHGERSWIQLQTAHIFCASSAREALGVAWFRARCGNAASIERFKKDADFGVGDTVLAVLSKRDTRSEPYIIEAAVDGTFVLRVLLRRHEVEVDTQEEEKAPPNELVYTDETIQLDVHSDGRPRRHARIMGRCIVRVFDAYQTIPPPYCRNGAGNVFYMTHRLVSDVPLDDSVPLCVPINAPLPAFRQGFDPATPVPRLRALELFCGCGNLGRGIEDAGATETRCANDIWPVAMHTFMANMAASDAVDPFIGSADTLLEHAIRGVHTVRAAVATTAIPRPGEIDFISGGSPCQGFSRLTSDKTTPQQFKNRSMVASFASFVDVYRPKYGILENVASMAESKTKTKSAKTTKTKAKASTKTSEDIFSQLVCALLGMGYQLRIMLGNAWFYGAPQQRQRVFLLFAAPGHALPEVPLPSHGPSTQIIGGVRALGFCKAIGDPDSGDWITTVLAPAATAFPFVSSAAATADLVDIDDGLVEICVPQPDHRLAVGITDDMRVRITQIPTQPYGLGLAEVRHTRAFGPMKDLFAAGHVAKAVTNAYKRHRPHGLFRTVRTACVIADARGPGELHWRATRPMTVMEMRRAQGIPDGDVLLSGGRGAADQWKMVGNAVARQIAVALGLAVREAYLGSLYEGGAVEVEVTASPKRRIFGGRR